MIMLLVSLSDARAKVYSHLCFPSLSLQNFLSDLRIAIIYVLYNKYYTLGALSVLFNKQVSLLNQEVIIEKLQSVVELKLRSSNESRIFQEQSKDIWMAKHLCIHKGHGRDAFLGKLRDTCPHQKQKTTQNHSG
nr:DNA mismatch repair protein MLH1 [Ipomoea batatas]